MFDLTRTVPAISRTFSCVISLSIYVYISILFFLYCLYFTFFICSLITDSFCSFLPQHSFTTSQPRQRLKAEAVPTPPFLPQLLFVAVRSLVLRQRQPRGIPGPAEAALSQLVSSATLYSVREPPGVSGPVTVRPGVNLQRPRWTLHRPTTARGPQSLQTKAAEGGRPADQWRAERLRKQQDVLQRLPKVQRSELRQR